MTLDVVSAKMANLRGMANDFSWRKRERLQCAQHKHEITGSRSDKECRQHRRTLHRPSASQQN